MGTVTETSTCRYCTAEVIRTVAGWAVPVEVPNAGALYCDGGRDVRHEPKSQAYRCHYGSLYATVLTAEQRERHGEYWFIVNNGAMSHTAFRTRAGLDRWMTERGLSLAEELPEPGTFGTTRIVGEYYTASRGVSLPDPGDGTWPGMVPDAEWDALQPVCVTVTMSNGRYTLALITEAEGVRTVHTLNPNVKTRVEFDWRQMRQLPA